MLGRESARAASTGWFQSEVFWVVGMLMGGSGAEERLLEDLVCCPEISEESS